MIAVEAARARMVGACAPLAAELVTLSEAHGRVLAADLVSRRTQPPFAVSAMDGYAVRAADLGPPGTRFKLAGYVQAGGRLDGVIGRGEAARIFTGAPVPDGADTVVIQEDVAVEGGEIVLRDAATPRRHVRARGLDFVEGEAVIPAGTRLTARHVGLAAAMNRPWLEVRRRPRVAILPTGDEVALPGDPIGPNQIVSSNGIALAGIVRACGGVPIQLGVAPDEPESLLRMAGGAAGSDLLVTTGGASVGDHDLIRSALGQGGLEVDFWKIAMRPGKPVMFGRLGSVPVLGLPMLERLQGLPGDGPAAEPALAGIALAANDRRRDHLRATIRRDALGRPVATPMAIQDSSMMSALALADALIVREPHAPEVAAGGPVTVIRLGAGTLAI
jgi:molybdopterin molybdotransferase